MDKGAEYYSRFLENDKTAFTQLVTEYWDGLVLYLTGFADDFTEAEEFAGETFLKLYADKPNFSGKSTFKTWLYSVGRNTAYYYARKRHRLNGIFDDDFFNIADSEDIERNHIQSEDKKLLRKAMEKLNKDYRQVLYLIYFEGFSNNEAAEIMNKNERQIRNLLYRAKAALKILLEKENFNYEEL